MSSFQDILRQYDYTLPPERIAQAPAHPRDSSKLVVFNRASDEASWTVFRDIGKYLPKNSVLVLNETKVIPARLFVSDAAEKRIGILWLGTTSDGLLRVLAKGKFESGDRLSLVDNKYFTVEGRADKELLLRPSFALSELESLMVRHGSMPLPPYIDQSPLSEEEIKERYQSVFAKNSGSIAAPTASLHFTPELLDHLQEQGIGIARVTLHVHLGTFSPLTEEQWNEGLLHPEKYSIESDDQELMVQAKKEGRTIVAVGTTAARTLESAFDAEGNCLRPSGETRLFIREGYAFKMVDALLTNFHVPKSSLLMLVSAFAGRENVINLYKEAIEREFRFFSFGDAMLII